jgi:hypothetical protein
MCVFPHHTSTIPLADSRSAIFMPINFFLTDHRAACMFPVKLSCFVIHVDTFRIAPLQTGTSPFDSCLLIRRLAMESFQDLLHRFNLSKVQVLQPRGSSIVE